MGIGISAVAMHHGGNIPYLDQYMVATCFQVFFLLYGHHHKGSSDILTDIRSRARSILTPYFLINLFLCIASLGMDLYTAKPLWPNFGNISLGVLYSRYFFYPIGTEPNITLMQSFNGPMWFLTALMTSSMLFYPLHRWMGHQSSRFHLSVILLICLGIAGAQLPILLPWSLDTAPFGALFMLVGARSRMRWQFQQHSTSARIGVLSITLLAYLALCWFNPEIHFFGRGYGPHGVISIFAMIGIGLLGSSLIIRLSMALEGSGAGTVLAFFGRHTIFILCLHMFVYYWVDMLVVTLLGVVFPTRSLWLLFVLLKVTLSLSICAGLSAQIFKVQAKYASWRLQHSS